MERLRLRVKDLEVARRELIVRDTHVLNRGGRGVRSPLDTV